MEKRKRIGLCGDCAAARRCPACGQVRCTHPKHAPEWGVQERQLGCDELNPREEEGRG